MSVLPSDSPLPVWAIATIVIVGITAVVALALLIQARHWWRRLTTQLVQERAVHTQMSQQNQILQSLIEVRTRELREAQEVIAKQNQTLDDHLTELTALHERLYLAYAEVEKKGTAVRESLEYARRIQQSLLPDPHALREHLPDSFVYSRPRDIVSGDFYWMYPQRRQLNLAVVDCTGHGVPGALMSMLGQTSLNQIVREFGDLTPEHILGELQQRIMALLRQDFSVDGDYVPPVDGMDVALIRLHWETGLLQFAGAHRPLLLVRQRNVQFIRGTGRSIGGMSRLDDLAGFQLTEVQLEPGDQIYLFTDGISDQFDPDKRKFGTERLCNLLIEAAHLPMEEQRQALDQAMRHWQGSQHQIDDMLLMGFRWQGPRPVFNLRRRQETEVDWAT